MSDSPVCVSLSVKGLQRLEAINHKKDFTFTVGAERYSCPSFIAEFLSTRVSSLRSQDPTIDEFCIETEDRDRSFGTLLSIGFGREVSFSQKEIAFVQSVCGELWNTELFEMTLKRDQGEIGEEEVKARLQFLSGADAPCDFDISLLASHFYLLSVSDFDGLSLSILEAILSDSRLLVADEDSVFEIVHRFASADLSYFGLLEFVRFEFLSADHMAKALEFISTSLESLTFGIWSALRSRLALHVTPSWSDGRLSVPAIESKIISSLPVIFSGFQKKTLKLLYRGSRDGFPAAAFHNHCNGYAHTLTLISSTNDCIFGGYSPGEWSARNGGVADPSLTSFLFTIQNPHKIAPRVFKQRQKERAIANSEYEGPIFGSGADLYVSGQAQRGISQSRLGVTYDNDTGIPGNEVLTGVHNFTVKEIEVFQVI
jgi:hypothetical protein